jgi:hypothetical protein
MHNSVTESQGGGWNGSIQRAAGLQVLIKGDFPQRHDDL